MGSRQIIVLLLGLACLAFAGTRFLRLFTPKPGTGAPPGTHQVFRCRVDGTETNLKPEELGRLIAEKRVAHDPKNPFNELYPCPKCGKLELEIVTVTPSGETRQ